MFSSRCVQFPNLFFISSFSSFSFTVSSHQFETCFGTFDCPNVMTKRNRKNIYQNQNWIKKNPKRTVGIFPSTIQSRFKIIFIFFILALKYYVDWIRATVLLPLQRYERLFTAPVYISKILKTIENTSSHPYRLYSLIILYLSTRISREKSKHDGKIILFR